MFKSAEQKQAELTQAYIAKYNLDGLDPRDIQTVRRIATELSGSGWFRVGMLLSSTSAADQLMTAGIRALVEQNWLIINQLTRLNKNLERLDK